MTKRRINLRTNTPEATIHRSILASIRDPIAVLDPSLRVITVNESFYKTFRVQAHETEGRPIYKLGNGQWHVPKLLSLLKDVLPRHSFFDDFEVTHDFEIIGRRTMLVSGREMTGEKIQPMIVVSMQDITERLQYQAHVVASEVRYRRLFEAAQEGILIIDPVSRKITDANSSLLQLLDFPSREIIGKELWEIGLLQGEQASHQFFRLLQQSGSVRLSDLPIESQKGSLIVELISNLYEEAGRKVIQCHVRDMTMRKRAEEAVRAREAELQTIIDRTAFMLTRCSRDLKYLFISRAYAEMIGRKADDVVGKPIQEIIGEAGYRTILPHIQNVLRGAFVQYETGIHFQGVGMRFLRVVYTPETDSRGNVTGWIASILDITEQKRAEEGLRKSEAMLLRAQRGARSGVWEIDLRSDQLFWSEPYYDLFGLMHSVQPTVETWLACMHPDDRPRIAQEFEEAMKAGLDQNMEFRIVLADGSVRWLHRQGQVERDSEGRAVRVSGVTLDVTQRKQAELALRESQQRLAYALDATVGGVWDWNIRTGQVLYSPQWIESLGYSMDEVPPHVSFWESLVHDEDMPRLRRTLQAHLEGRVPIFECQNRLRRKDGTYRWNLDRGKVVEWDADGKPLRMVGTDTDITDRKALEEELRQTLVTNQAVMASMGEGLYTLDANGLITYVNPMAERLLGWQCGELLGSKMHDIIHYKHRDGTPFPAEECKGFLVLREGKVLVGQPDVFIRKDGTFFDVVYSSSPIYFGDTLNGLVVVFREVQ